MTGSQARSRRWWNRILIAVPLLFIAAPFLFFAVLYLGFPPVLGNLAAAHAMTSYAAQAHPDWEAEGFWAGYNLVDDGYYMDFSDGHALRYGLRAGLVYDEEREEELRDSLDIDRAFRRYDLWREGSYCYWSAAWSPKTPDTPFIKIRLDFYDAPDAPIPDEAAMRARMADRGMEVYEALSPLAPPDRFSVFYCHQGVTGEDPGAVWNIMTLDLETPLTRETLLAAPLTVK